MEIEESYLSHYGIIRRSGRYPWGSGKDENTHNKILLDYISELKTKGMKDPEIAKGLGMTTTEYRAERSMARTQQKQAQIAMAERLKEKGYSNVAIGKRMGLPESTVRSLLAPGAKDKADVLQTTANMLRTQVEEKGFIDVGSGVENYVGVSRSRLDTAIAMLKNEGYELHSNVKVLQLGTGHETNMKVLGPPGSTWGDAQRNRDKIQQITNFSDDGGRSFGRVHRPMPVDPNRVGILYGNEGGSKADGMIYLRPGAENVSLGGAKYAQVRVAVGDSHYIKGMAMFRDDLPDGVDILYCVDKNNTGNKFDAMKENSADPDNPFGAVVRQVLDNPGTPNERVSSVLNIVSGTSADPDSGNIEGKWETWSRNLSSQMLSKQSPELARSQLDMTYERRRQEYDDIMALTNNTVKKRLLDDFADGADSASVHLQAAALPRQSVRVLLPVSTLSPTQVYAPTYRNGEQVVLIRHPHGGTFEIPNLTVNNRHAESKKLLGNSRDAIGIHHEVARRLSGADFDGDTVVVIPDPSGRITITPALEGLKSFDPRASYPAYEGMKPMKNTQAEMGKISNLITDMSIKGAPHSEISRAIKHSMVVIDAEKHNLNYRLSYNDNNIKDLVSKYQTQPGGGAGAATLISRARAKTFVPERKPRRSSKGGPIDLETGEKVYEETGRISYRTGKPRLTRTTKLAEARDAATLSSGTRMEALYADHSNKLKSLANQARLVSKNTPSSEYSPSAAKTYKTQVDSLNAKLTIAERNRPLERQAQLIANARYKATRDANPNMDEDTKKKVRFQALEEARVRTGAKKKMIEVTPAEWDAIQAGAISSSKLTQILNHSKMEVVRELATPRQKVLMTSAKIARATDMLALGYTRAEVADQLGVSLTTLDEGVKS